MSWKKEIKDPIEKNLNKVRKEIESAEREIEKEIILNVPNSITLLRLILLFVFVYLLFQNYNRVVLLVVFAVAAVTDWFDGFFARKLNQKTKFGAVMDQVVDRIFTITIVIAIILYLIIYMKSFNNIFGLSSHNVFLLIFLTCSREIIGFQGVIINTIRRKVIYHVKYIGKVTTFIQSVTIGAIILGADWASLYLAIATCIIGIVSGFDYLKYSLS